MRNPILPFVRFLSVAALALPARASDGDLSGAILIGSGVDTGDGDNNPYQLQFGGTVELIINGYVFGFRGVRTLGSQVERVCETRTGRGAECNIVLDD